MILTDTQVEGLRRIRDRGSSAWAQGKDRAGGAVSRMFQRLVDAGQCTGPPYEITKAGRMSILEYDTADAKRRRKKWQ